MGLNLKLGRGGELRPNWYGEYRTKEGKRVEVNLGVKIAGEPPESLKVSDDGNAAFENSRAKAAARLEELQGEARKGRMDKTTAFRIYRERTGATIKETMITALPDVELGTQNHDTSTAFSRWRRKVVGDFTAWALAKSLKTVLDVSKDVARDYLEYQYTPNDVGAVRTASTVRRVKTVLGLLFDRALPEGAPNPFRAKDLTISPAKGDTEYHREPLTDDEIKRLLEVAQSDRMVFDLIVCALSTGLRKGDVCRLRWDGVNLRMNALRLTTSKTKTDLYLPILPVFKAVLERRLAEKEAKAIYVFPEAEKMMRENETGITWRMKKAFALALGETPEAETDTLDRKNLKDVFVDVLKSINSETMTDGKRKVVIDFVTRYADGQSVRTIEKETGKPRSTVSSLLNEAQRLSGIHFIKSGGDGSGGIKKAIATVTRVKRKHGIKSASKYDFHALRTTFVTIAIKNGISIDKLRALTGHATVEIVMRHYFKPKGTDFSNELAQVMPQALTDTSEVRQLPPPAPRRGIDKNHRLPVGMARSVGKKLDNVTALLETLSEAEITKLKKLLQKQGA